ncbi:class I adenylate-forming enzyme family protein [Kitasatospora sp. LaBMicrA B282]|uniref:class I adenylate-forming enzyme family protein n=1 Tax=Kitasatospora sp. LaBMicrA B282 TaxID=3420949 RepID=UPI003D0A2B85
MTAKLYTPDAVLGLDEFEQQALAIAEVLRERQVAPGTRVLLKAGNSVGYLAALFALMHLGASIVLVDQQDRPAETREICARAGVALCLVDDDAPLAAESARTYLYELLLAAADQRPATAALDFSTWCALPDGLVMWSSGSTGKPKGIVKTGGSFLTNLERNAAHMGHRADDVLLPMLPFSHQYGLSMVLIAWLARCSLVIAPYRRLDHTLLMAGRCGATVLDATPATYRSMLNIIGRRPAAAAELRTVRMFCSGAAPLSPGLVDDYVAAFGLPLLDSYGSTELGNIAFATGDNAVDCGQVMDGIGLRIVDDEGTVQPAGEIGEIEVDTPDMMTGLLLPDGTFRPAERGWYRTGDFGRLDAAGNLSVVGRKLAVHRNGYTLYPEIIEHKLAAGGVLAKVLALPDERRGCELVCFVEDEGQQDRAVWRERINELLPVYERPNRVEVLDRFPLNRNGKPDKRQLENLLAGAAA